MSLQLILGNSGSGKSRHLYRNIIEASVRDPFKKFLVIVPEQFTMQTQKELVEMHPRKGVMGIDILSFQRLAHRIFEEVGTDRRMVLEETGKTLLLRRAAARRQGELKILKGNMKKQGYLTQVKSMISELTQYDIDSEKMDQLLQSAKGKPQLYYKLQDIQVLYESFREELQGKYITAEETLDALCQVAEQSQILRDSVIALDGFTGFTPIQQKLLGKLLSLAKEVYVTVTIDARQVYAHIRGEHELFYLSKKTIKGLLHMVRENGCELLPPVVLGEGNCPRFKKGGQLEHLEQNLFRAGKKKTYGGEEERELFLHSGENPRGEVRFAARTIRGLVRSGYRYQDIAVIVGNMEAFQNYIPRVFQEYEIPCFMDNTRSLFANPFIEFLRGILDMIQQNYTGASVFRVLRTGLCHMDSSDIDLLENYVLAAGIRGFSRWNKEFTMEPESLTEEEMERCRSLRQQFMEPLGTFTRAMKDKTANALEKTKALYYLVCHFQVQNQLEEYEENFRQEGRADLQKEYAQVYSLVMGLFDKIANLLGEEQLNVREYSEILEAGFEEVKVGIIPPAADQVQVGDLERTRLKDVKILFFLGLNDGWVPPASKGSGLLSDMEREELNLSGVELAPTARQDSYIQKFYLYLNLTKPSQRLYLSYSRAFSDGSLARPSYVTRVVNRLFPNLSLTREEGMEGIAAGQVTPRSGLELLVEGFERIREESPEREWLELYGWYRQDERYQRRLDKLVEAAFLTFDEKGIGRAAAKRLYGEILVNSVSRLERFASCAFAHFLQYGLKIQEREEFGFQAPDMGRICHEVIETVSRKIQDSQEYNWFHLPDEVRDSMVEEAVTDATESYGQKVLHSSARNEYLIQRMSRILKRTAWALQKQIQSGNFYPANFEVSFHQVEDLESVNVALWEKEKMKLQGRIDRIDICEKEDQVYVKVIDYKTGNTQLDLVALYHGLQLQLVVYLSAAVEMEQRIHPGKTIVPAGIFYYHIKDPLLAGESEETPEVINQRILRELRLGGLVNQDPQVFGEMDKTMEKVSNVIPLTLKNDGTPSKTWKTMSTEEFEYLSSFVHQKIGDLGRRIMDGETAPVPYERKQQTGCDYCVYQAVCGRDSKIPGTRYNRLQEIKPEEILEEMGNIPGKEEQK